MTDENKKYIEYSNVPSGTTSIVPELLQRINELDKRVKALENQDLQAND